ncbi:MAG: helix-turn-helix domain-containing protein [Lentisphaerae bacterium]|nr:helix-turn-helix domain-containing protein [Lentisphaerota bacterium]
MTQREYLTTGDTAALLRVSRSTVSRMFDAGELTGKLNPLTRQRLIRRDSVEAVMATHGLQSAQESASPRILLASTDARIRNLVTQQGQTLGGLLVELAETGADTLVRCARRPPRLLILDASLPDLPPADIVAALRPKSDQPPFPIICLGLSERENAAIPTGTALMLPAGPKLTADLLERTIADVLDIKKPHPIGVSHFEHHRQWSRKNVSVNARVAIYSARRPRRSAWGTGLLRNISRGGAYIDNLRIESTDLLAKPFRMLVELSDPPWVGWKAYCRVVRLASNGELSAGVEFIRTPRRHQDELAIMLGDA